MFYFSLFFLELIFLFLISRSLTQYLSLFIYKMTRSKTVTISLLAFLFFPGTLIHELAHALSAGLLGVRVGTMEFLPKIEGEHVKLGSVQIAQTDPIRRFFIGAAPFFLGTFLLLGILFYATNNKWFDNTLLGLVVGYIVFEIGNTMFSSRKDMEGALELFGTLILLTIIFYLLGVRLPSFNPAVLFSQPFVEEVFRRGSFFLLVPLAIDCVIVLLLHPKKYK